MVAVMLSCLLSSYATLPRLRQPCLNLPPPACHLSSGLAYSPTTCSSLPAHTASLTCSGESERSLAAFLLHRSPVRCLVCPPLFRPPDRPVVHCVLACSLVCLCNRVARPPSRLPEDFLDCPLHLGYQLWPAHAGKNRSHIVSIIVQSGRG
jgi:hypothetical protein